MDIFTQAKTGTLTGAQLKSYLQRGNTVNDTDTRGVGYSLISTAAKAGQAGTVKLLLDNGANPQLPSGHGCYPLWVAANAKKNRPEIIQMLLDKGARPDDTSEDCDNDTPLMVAITQSRDCKVISMLVDAGASLEKKNNDGLSARELAEQSGDARILTALAPAHERPLARPDLINAIVTLVVFILNYVNSGVIRGVVKGVVSTLYHINKDATPNTELLRVRIPCILAFCLSHTNWAAIL
jgi:ankyrin repeat protein